MLTIGCDFSAKCARNCLAARLRSARTRCIWSRAHSAPPATDPLAAVRAGQRGSGREGGKGKGKKGGKEGG